MFALDLGQWEFAFKGKVPQHPDGGVSVGKSSLDTGGMALKGMFFDALRVSLIGPTWR